MSDVSLVDYFILQERQARRSLDNTIGLARYVWLIVPATVVLVVPVSLHYGHPGWGGCVALACVWLSWVIARLSAGEADRLEGWLLKLRAEIRHVLLDQGLLLLALEADPGERLPRLFHPGPISLLGYSKKERGTSRGHLMALAANYLDCCEDAGIASPLAEELCNEQQRGQGNQNLVLTNAVILELAHLVRQDLTSAADSGFFLNAARGSTSDQLE